MIISEALQQFYKENNFNDDGGFSEDYFELKFNFFTLKLPNSQFRKDVIHIHDIQHILYNCDASWNGEAFIAGWEISTGIWKHIPIGFFSLWAMGFTLFIYPKEVFKGYKAGLNTIGIIDLKIEKEVLLEMSVSELNKQIKKDKIEKINWFQFLFWVFTSTLVFVSPLLVLIALGIVFY
ncbi:hypothetical protein N9Q68_00115 [Polaribacter sp.]|nr:hypothetical protein [Polaribacter sp.]